MGTTSKHQCSWTDSGRNVAKLIEGVSPKEFAGWWGCDPVYDRPPRQPGDGYLFYNFGSKLQERTDAWLYEFIAAINRTLSGQLSHDDHDGLVALRNHVESLITETNDE